MLLFLRYFLLFFVDHFSPSYFDLLGPLDRANLAEQIIPEYCVRILNALSVAGIRYLLAGNAALTLHGVPRMPADLDLLIDPDEFNLQRFLEALGSESWDPGEATAFAQLQDEKRKTPYCLRLSDNSGHQIRALIKTPVPFAHAFERRVSVLSGSLMIDLMSLEDLILIRSGSADPPKDCRQRPPGSPMAGGGNHDEQRTPQEREQSPPRGKSPSLRQGSHRRR